MSNNSKKSYECEACDKEVLYGDKFCKSCGAELNWNRTTQKTYECIVCDKEVSYGDKFCKSCGAELDWDKGDSKNDLYDHSSSDSETPNKNLNIDKDILLNEASRIRLKTAQTFMYLTLIGDILLFASVYATEFNVMDASFMIFLVMIALITLIVHGILLAKIKNRFNSNTPFSVLAKICFLLFGNLISGVSIIIDEEL